MQHVRTPPYDVISFFPLKFWYEKYRLNRFRTICRTTSIVKIFFANDNGFFQSPITCRRNSLGQNKNIKLSNNDVRKNQKLISRRTCIHLLTFRSALDDNKNKNLLCPTTKSELLLSVRFSVVILN